MYSIPILGYHFDYVLSLNCLPLDDVDHETTLFPVPMR